MLRTLIYFGELTSESIVATAGEIWLASLLTVFYLWRGCSETIVCEDLREGFTVELLKRMNYDKD